MFTIAILLPEIETKHVLNIVKKFRDEFECESALFFPVHITVIYEIETQIETLTDIIKSVAKNFKPFVLTTKEIGFFDNDFWATNPYVVYLNINNSEKLNQLRQTIIDKLIKSNVKFRDMKTFNPHITLAHDDLKKEYFELAISKAKNLHKDFTFKVENIAVLKQLKNEKWIVEKQLVIGRDYEQT